MEVFILTFCGTRLCHGMKELLLDQTDLFRQRIFPVHHEEIGVYRLKKKPLQTASVLKKYFSNYTVRQKCPVLNS